MFSLHGGRDEIQYWYYGLDVNGGPLTWRILLSFHVRPTFVNKRQFTVISRWPGSHKADIYPLYRAGLPVLCANENIRPIKHYEFPMWIIICKLIMNIAKIIWNNNTLQKIWYQYNVVARFLPNIFNKSSTGRMWINFEIFWCASKYIT